jgi:hypothetical protein
MTLTTRKWQAILAWSRRSWQRATIRTDSGEVQTLMRISHNQRNLLQSILQTETRKYRAGRKPTESG